MDEENVKRKRKTGQDQTRPGPLYRLSFTFPLHCKVWISWSTNEHIILCISFLSPFSYSSRPGLAGLVWLASTDFVFHIIL